MEPAITWANAGLDLCRHMAWLSRDDLTHSGLNSMAINHIDGLMQERRNSIANALELRLSCTKPSIWSS